jgi:hypothetical protein
LVHFDLPYIKYVVSYMKQRSYILIQHPILFCYLEGMTKTNIMMTLGYLLWSSPFDQF